MRISQICGRFGSEQPWVSRFHGPTFKRLFFGFVVVVVVFRREKKVFF